MSIGKHHDLAVVACLEELFGTSMQQSNLRISGPDQALVIKGQSNL